MKTSPSLLVVVPFVH